MDFSVELIRQFCTHSRCDITPAGFDACFLLGESETLINRSSTSLTPPVSTISKINGGCFSMSRKTSSNDWISRMPYHWMQLKNLQCSDPLTLTRRLHSKFLRKTMCVLNWLEVPTTPCTWDLAGLLKIVKNYFTGAKTQTGNTLNWTKLNFRHLSYRTIFKSYRKTAV